MKGWPLIETLLVLLAANAIVGLVAVAMLPSGVGSSQSIGTASTTE